MKYTLVFLDTETTGKENTDRLCQLAYKKLDEPMESLFNHFYKPPVPISIGSMAVHHITSEMVADKPLFIESPEYETTKHLLEEENTVVICHNAQFDVAILKRENIRPANSIDTLRLVRFLDPDMIMEKHNLQYLRYLLELDKDTSEKIEAHDAKGDVIILELLFKRLLKKMRGLPIANSNVGLPLTNSNVGLPLTPSKGGGIDISDEAIIEEMMRISKEPMLIGKFAFGKHNGKRVADVAVEDPGYLQWLLTQKRQSENPDSEADWIHTLEHFLKT